jgi:hypothetical protein
MIRGRVKQGAAMTIRAPRAGATMRAAQTRATIRATPAPAPTPPTARTTTP